MLDARKKPTQDICQIIRKPLKQNKIQHHAIKTMNIKSFLTWKLLYLFVVVVNLCHAILDDFWILWTQSTCLKSSNPHSKKSTNPILRAIIPLFPSTTMTPYLWLSFLNIQPFCSYTHFPCKKIPIPSKKNPSLKNISWPVPLTSFGPRFKRKKKTNPSNYSSEEHYSNKTNTYHHYPKLPYFFIVVKLNNYLFFMKGLFVLQLHTH